MRIAVVGALGQLGTDLLSCIEGDVAALDLDEIDITDWRSVDTALTALKPELVINVAAYNFVDRAEDEPEVAFAVNAFGPRNLARFCADNDIVLLHVSTDYVFGHDTERAAPYNELDAPGAISAYGTSKLAGEHFVRSLCPRHFVVRTCGLYGHAAAGGRGKGNFVETMLRLGAERDELRVVDDQWCTPTSTADLALALCALAKTDAYGLYHSTNTGSTTWCRLAQEIFRQTDCPVHVTAITSAEFPTKANRPRYSVLDTSKLAETIGFASPCWQDALAAYLAGREEGGG